MRGGIGEEFLSIDIEALLRKLPSRSFRSASHYPVELVRSALRRGATRVDVDVRRSAIVVADDGPALDPRILDSLLVVFDAARSPEARHDALASFERDDGIGILAAFAPAPSEVELWSGGKRLAFRRGRPPTSEPAGPISGTRIRIARTRSSPAGERETLAEHCRGASAAVVVDGRLVSRRAVPEDAIAVSTLPAWSTVRGGHIWIPATGDVCRAYHLDHGIRTAHSFLAPDDGLVYEASVECGGQAPEDLRIELGRVALTLYERLARVRGAGPALLTRIEELLTGSFRRTRDPSLLDVFAPFATFDGRSLSLTEVIGESGRGTLHALRFDDDPSRYVGVPGTLLRLTPTQWQFLSDEAGVRLLPPVPAPPSRSWAWRLAGRLRAAVEARISSLGAVRPVARDELSAQERRLLDLVAAEVESGRYVLPVSPSPGGIEVTMSSSAGAPGRIIEAGGRTVLAVSRANPLVRKAAAAVSRDPASIEIVLALLTRGRGVAVTRRASGTP